ncbi:Uncharacterised protein [Lysinibacillus sphaericus]|uniref:Uncharacterized protein n=1 Tax=Lysinibacillus sphaericus TaxID=1421 RepID=A0A2S0K4N9_LYSSH|nr:hypothetical protein [Lysinibacillus sphaericus]AVK98340.1 hypothetical protein LS41612_19535 [Lysinibacillus sphaericus]GEC80926.1 hypothetical protein LSP03_06690 [Lysinibacillus sphaericus]SUV15694.1 Uncharacterised protein [Lysinibacillus sphaericus]
MFLKPSGIIIEVGIIDLVVSDKNTKAKMVSIIGVLEYLTIHREILKVKSENPYIYYYISVPFFHFLWFF